MIYGISREIAAVRNGVGNADIIPGYVGASGSPAGSGAIALTASLTVSLAIALAASLTVSLATALPVSLATPLTVSLTAALTISLAILTVALTIALTVLTISLSISLAILTIILAILTLVGGKTAPPCGGIAAHLLQLIRHSLQGLR